MDAQRFQTHATECTVAKVNKKLGLVFGFAAVSKANGAEYFDTQGDALPDETLLESATEFMLERRVSGEMHEVQDGTPVFLFPLTEEIAKALGIVSSRYGLLYGAKPSPEVFAKFESGEYTGFSIGGKRLEEQVVER